MRLAENALEKNVIFSESLFVSDYSEFMILASAAIRLLVMMFFAGLVGAGIVVSISFFEDFKELFGEE